MKEIEAERGQALGDCKLYQRYNSKLFTYRKIWKVWLLTNGVNNYNEWLREKKFWRDIVDLKTTKAAQSGPQLGLSRH
jgi:hypothetical protein